MTAVNVRRMSQQGLPIIIVSHIGKEDEINGSNNGAVSKIKPHMWCKSKR